MAELCPHCKETGRDSCFFDEEMVRIQAGVPKKIVTRQDFDKVQDAGRTESYLRREARRRECPHLNKITLSLPSLDDTD